MNFNYCLNCLNENINNTTRQRKQLPRKLKLESTSNAVANKKEKGPLDRVYERCHLNQLTK